MQDVCHNKPIKYDLTRHVSPSRSVVRASHQCAEGHRKPTHDT